MPFVLSQQLEQTAILPEDTGRKPTQVIVDLGYRGVDHDNPDVEIIHRGKYKLADFVVSVLRGPDQTDCHANISDDQRRDAYQQDREPVLHKKCHD